MGVMKSYKTRTYNQSGRGIRKDRVKCLGNPDIEDHYFWSWNKKHNRICPKCSARNEQMVSVINDKYLPKKDDVYED